MARPKIEDPRDGINARFKRSTLARAEKVAKKTDRSLRGVISDALEDYVKKEEKKLAKTG